MDTTRGLALTRDERRPNKKYSLKPCQCYFRKMKIFIFFAIALCVYASDVKETASTAEPVSNKDKRQTEDEGVPTRLAYRIPRKQVAPVEEPQEEDKETSSRSDSEVYRPGQVFSLNPQELIDLQPERKPLSGSQLLQQLYPQQEQKQSSQQIYYLEPQTARQIAIQPSHAVIARPHYSLNGGEASVGAALAVSDTGANSADSFDQELLALLGREPGRQEDTRPQTFSQQTSTAQSVAPLYQSIDQYQAKPSKKPTKLRAKVQYVAAPSTAAPQQYLIETTNVQQQQQQQQQQIQQQQIQQQQQLQQQQIQQQHQQSAPVQLQYRTLQPQRAPQALRYVSIPQTQSIQQSLYENSENQGLKVVAAPKLQPQQRPINFRFVPYQQPEAAPKQYRIVEAPRLQPIRQEQRLQASSVERPLTYLKRYPEPDKMRSVKIYEPVTPEGVPLQQAQILNDQYYLRPVYRADQRARYELQTPVAKQEPQRLLEPTKPPHSAIYVSKNLAPRKQVRPQSTMRYEQKIDQPQREQQYRYEQPSNIEQVNIEQNGRSLEEQRSQLPPPRNNKAYTPEEFAALVAAGYSVTPVPVGSLNSQAAESRSSVEAVTPLPKRRYSSRHQYLPRRGDDAP